MSRGRARLTIVRRWRGAPVSAAFVRRVVRATLRAQRRRLDLTIVLAGDGEIRRVNRAFLGHDWATDVVAFPLDAGEGEVIVSVATARREARGRAHGWRAELALYLAHGVLHLCGHDDKRPAARRRMIRAERAVLGRIGYRVEDRG